MIGTRDGYFQAAIESYITSLSLFDTFTIRSHPPTTQYLTSKV